MFSWSVSLQRVQKDARGMRDGSNGLIECRCVGSRRLTITADFPYELQGSGPDFFLSGGLFRSA